MLIGKLILKLLPFSVYHKIRARYREFKRLSHKPLNEQQFRQILTSQLKVKSGDVLFIHSSVDKLNISFTPHRLLEILLEVVGAEGTLIFPAWHFNYRAEDYLSKQLVFDVKKSPSALGLLSELARRYPGAKRSLHPTSSIVSIGKNSEYLVATHHLSVYPCGELSPFYKMMEFDAKIIGLGVSTDFLSFVHCPEDVLKGEFPYKTRKETLYTGKVKDLSGNIINVVTLVPHPDIKFRNIPRFIKSHIPPLTAFDTTIRGNHFFFADAKSLFNMLVQLSKVGKSIYGA